MTYKDIGAIYATKSGAFDNLLRLTAGLSAAQALHKPSDSAWSVAGVTEHLALVDRQLVQLIATLVKRTEDAGRTRPPHAPIEISVGDFLERSRTEKYVTRDKFAPTGTMSLHDSLKTLRDAHGQLTGLRQRLDAIDLAFASFPHWIFGPLTLGQWLAFIGLHEERHVAQVEEILSSPAFPEH